MKKLLLYTLSIALLLVSACSKNGDNKPTATIDAQTVSMHYDETHQYSVTNTTGLTWTSSDATVGTIDNSGLFTAKKIGKTIIKGTSGNISVQSTVTVTPYSTMCQEPYFILGASMATIEGKETRLLYGSTATGLLYTGENSKLRYAEYIFDNTGFIEAALLLANTTDVVDEASTFFKERYTLLGT
ncbi:MAG: Ig-like domain-containing protein, partial [Sphingobacteriales bacterium]